LAIDVSFHRTVAPGSLDGHLHRTLILLQGANEALHFVDAGGGGLVHPRVQRLDLGGFVRWYESSSPGCASPRIQGKLSSRHPALGSNSLAITFLDMTILAG